MDYLVDIQSKIIIQRTYQTGFNMGLLNAVSLKLIQLIASFTLCLPSIKCKQHNVCMEITVQEVLWMHQNHL